MWHVFFSFFEPSSLHVAIFFTDFKPNLLRTLKWIWSKVPFFLKQDVATHLCVTGFFQMCRQILLLGHAWQVLFKFQLRTGQIKYVSYNWICKMLQPLLCVSPIFLSMKVCRHLKKVEKHCHRMSHITWTALNIESICK